MEQPASATRYPCLEHLVILAQSDTTVGLLSMDAKRLASLKGRKPTKPFIVNFFTLETLKEYLRIPKSRKKELRRAKRTTYVVKNFAFRVARPPASSALYRHLKWCYTTSANRSGKHYDANFAKEASDAIIINPLGLSQQRPSSIIKCNNKRKKRLR